MLKKRRLDLDMTQYDLAKAASVAQVRISLAERDLIDLRDWEKEALAQVLGVPAPELFSRIGERELFRQVRPFLNIEERSWLLDAGCDSFSYRQRLQELGRKYGVIETGRSTNE